MGPGQEIDLLLIGKTGNGKSATGNSILRSPQRFKAMPTTQSVTTKIQLDHSVFNGRPIKVVDGPGVGDTRMSDEEAVKEMQRHLIHTITANPEGYHAFLLVVRYGGRFTGEDVQTISCLKKIFGADFVKNYCILVITCGDNFEADAEEEEMTFDQWLHAQGGCFQEMRDECNGRVILFDNKTKDNTKKNIQLARLVSLVDSLGGKRYTDENFEKARHLRERQMIESKEQRVREETLKETSVFSQRLEEIQQRLPEDQIPVVKDILNRASHLFQSVQDQDKGTGALKYSMEAACSIITQAKSQLDHCEKVVSDKKKFYQEQERLQEEFNKEIQRYKDEYERQVQEIQKQEEEKGKEEREALQRKLDEEFKDKDRRQKEELEALRKEMENKSQQERVEMEKRFEEQVKRSAAVDEENKKAQLRDSEIKRQEAHKILEEKYRKDLERERQKMAEEERRREEERDRRRKEEQERHEREREMSRQMYRQAKKEVEELMLKGIMACVMSVAQVIFHDAQKRKKEATTRGITDDNDDETDSDEDESDDSYEKIDYAGAIDNELAEKRRKEENDEGEQYGKFERKKGEEEKMGDKDERKKGVGKGENYRDMDQTEVVY